MNFANFNPANSSHSILDQLFKNVEVNRTSNPKNNRENILKESYENRDRSFENMLEKKAQKTLNRSKEEVELSNHQVKEKSEGAKSQISEELTDTFETLAQLLAILEKLIQNKELTRNEQSFLVKNQDLLTQVANSGTNGLGKESDTFLKQLNNYLGALEQGEAKHFSKELLGQMENLALKLKELTLLGNIENKGNSWNSENRPTLSTTDLTNNIANDITKNAKSISSLSSLENLIDLTNLKATDTFRSLKLEDIYIKPNNGFGVLKGTFNTQELNSTLNQATTDPNKTTVNPTHQNNNINNISGINTNHIQANSSNINNTGIGTQTQRNTVVNFSSTSATSTIGQPDGSLTGVLFSREGQNNTAQVNTRMFAGQSTSQSINLRPFIEQLTGQIHRGFVNGQQIMLVKLQPENLGAVGIVLRKESENALHLKLNVDSIEVKELIEKYSGDIKTGLGKENLDLLTFDVNISDNGANPSGQGKEHSTDEKKFNEISLNTKNKILDTEKTQTVDLRLSQGMLNIKI